jgi:hypothetical protein
VEGKLIQGFEGLDVGDRVRVQRIGDDVERGFIDSARAGLRHNPDSSVLPPQLLSCFRTNVLLDPLEVGGSYPMEVSALVVAK